MPAGVQLLDSNLISQTLEQARSSPRLRTNHNFHALMEENPHRFLNVMLRGTYIAPHRHLNPPKSESFLVLEGEAAFFVFDDHGRVEASYRLGKGCIGIDVAPGIWHTLTVLTPHAVCYEVKPGPYSVQDDKTFAPWAPREGEPGVAEYLSKLEALATTAQRASEAQGPRISPRNPI
jgi:cupin fold WbuC family metalloprotein